MALDSATKLRRLRRVVKELCALDLEDPELKSHLRSLKTRANVALSETRLGRGNPVSLDSARQIGHARLREKGRATAERVGPIIKSLRASGATDAAIAAALDKRKIPPPRSKRWSVSSVRAIEKRLTE